ncbi:MAG: FG-GAP repeat domain-containing protein, partial [Rubripirellula sp.]
EQASLPNASDMEAPNILAEDMRQFIWDVEHIAFEMEAKILPQVKQALTEPNAALLSRFLSPGFRGKVPSEDWQVVASANDWQIRRKEITDGSTQVSALKFASQMAGYRALFDSADDCECGSSIGLVRLGPDKKDSIDGPWSGQWRIRMWGEREGHPLELLMSLSVDLEPLRSDVESQTNFIRYATLETIERRESEAPLFRDVTAQSGIQISEMYDFWELPSNQFKGSSGGVYLSDYDDDGNVDALVDDAFIGPVLYRGLGDGSFANANEQAGIPSGLPSPSGACWADLDNDGDVDLILAGVMFSNDGDGTFSLIPSDRPTFDVGVAFSVADYDGDGLVDIYESHAHSPSVPQKMREGPNAKRTEKPSWIDGGWGFDNVLWKNLGDWQFQDVTQRANAGDRGGAAFSSIWLHANEDRDPDLLSINEFGRNSLLINRGNGSFQNTRLDPVFGGWSMGVVAGDYDNDGFSDVFISNMYSKAGNRVISNVDPSRYPEYLYKIIHEGTLGNKLYRSRGDGTFETVEHDPVFAQVGWTYGCSFTDYNGDGNLDLYATAGFKSEKKGKPDG